MNRAEQILLDSLKSEFNDNLLLYKKLVELRDDVENEAIPVIMSGDISKIKCKNALSIAIKLIMAHNKVLSNAMKDIMEEK